jgi:hypothetical protein
MSILKSAAVISVIALAVCAAAPAPSPANTLSRAEQAQGWKLLFNGKDLAGWRVYHKANVPPQWAVQDGTIALTSGGAGDLMTVEEYGDFDLQLDWKISPKGNSGVIYRIKERDDAPQTYNTGPEMQVLDNDGHADGKIPSHRAGAIYDLVVPKEGAVRPVGEWNQARIVLRKGHLEHWLNGQKVAESSYGDDKWRAMVAASKFKTMPEFGKAQAGHIALQDHGNQVWYRNIKIRKL